MINYFNYEGEFALEGGQVLRGLTIAYHTYGTLNADKSNVVWICHALTSNSDVTDWWPGVIGNGEVISPEEHFIVCSNIIGSCYGSTGPLSINPITEKPYFNQFPMVTIRDMANAHILLRKHLAIENIYLLMGGSMGGYQAMEWAIMEKELVENLFLTVTSAAESAWGIAIHAAQRLALEADGTWGEQSAEAGKKGLKAARALGMLTYRNYGILKEKQADSDPDKTDDFKASSYINYQGEKLANRFNAYSYWCLTKAMDSHNISRGRVKSIEEILKEMFQKTLIVGITSDILCPVVEQQFIAQHLPNSSYVEIDSSYGHDGFLIEAEKISFHLKKWMDR